MKYTINVLLTAPGEDLPLVHLSDNGYGTTTDTGEHDDQWREVYCHDDGCGWMIGAPSASYIAVVSVPNVEEPSE
jgi:hypothetical protein